MMEVIQEHEKAAAEMRLAKFFMEYSLETKTHVAPKQEDVEIPEIVNGGAAKWIVPVALGAAGFFTAGATWAAIPAAISGVALGMSLTAGIGDQGSKRPKRKQPTYTFSMGGSDDGLARQGDVLPIVYCNSVVNPKGGVNWSGKMVAAKVYNRGDSGYLVQVLALSLGRLGSIDLSRTLINKQPTDQFFPEDLSIEFLPGSPSFYSGGVQTGFQDDDFNFLGHVVSPSTFNNVGVNLRALSANDSSSSASLSLSGWSTFNCFFSSNVITKNSGEEGEFDSYAVTEDSVGEGGGSFSFKMVSSQVLRAGFGFGLSSELDYSINTFLDGTMSLSVFGTTYTTDLSSQPFLWNINDTLGVDLTYDVNDNKIVNFVQNSVTIFTVQNNWTNQKAKVTQANINKAFQIENVNGFFFPTSPNSFDAVEDSGSMIISVYEDDRSSIANFEKFTPAELYSANGKEFRIVQKIPAVGGTGSLVSGNDFFNPFLTLAFGGDRNRMRCVPFVEIDDEDSIHAIWKGYYQTLRKCTSVTFNLDTLLFSREKPEQDDGGKK